MNWRCGHTLLGVERLLGRLSAAMHGCDAAAFESKCRCQESALFFAP
jgi:hypothetical protein